MWTNQQQVLLPVSDIVKLFFFFQIFNAVSFGILLTDTMGLGVGVGLSKE